MRYRPEHDVKLLAWPIPCCYGFFRFMRLFLGLLLHATQRNLTQCCLKLKRRRTRTRFARSPSAFTPRTLPLRRSVVPSPRSPRYIFQSNMMLHVDIRKKLYSACRVVCGTAIFHEIDEHTTKEMTSSALPSTRSRWLLHLRQVLIELPEDPTTLIATVFTVEVVSFFARACKLIVRPHTLISFSVVVEFMGPR